MRETRKRRTCRWTLRGARSTAVETEVVANKS
jgi:hypothetical protein